MALQNTQRRPTRTLMLVIAVALGTAAVFASYTVSRGIMASTERSFARMGADLVVVPTNAMVNITSALLTVQPTEETINLSVVSEISKLDGVAAVSAQSIYKVGVMAGMPEHRENLIAYDPATDFTITPWVVSKLPRSIADTDVLVGGRRAQELNDELQLCGNPATVYAKLGRSGVGPLDDNMFAPYSSVAKLTKGADTCTPPYDNNRVSAIFLRLKFGSTPEQVKFAIARIPGVKVIQGATIVTSTRQTTTILFNGMLIFAAVMLLGSLLLVGLLFSAIVAERRREIGVLQALGARRKDVMSMLVCEASLTTILGGLLGIVFGCALLFVFQNSLVYYLTTLHIEFSWPEWSELTIAALVCLTMAGVVGLFAALLPAWRSTKDEPYLLIQREDLRC